jgi:protein-disulfide isomerase
MNSREYRGRRLRPAMTVAIASALICSASIAAWLLVPRTVRAADTAPDVMATVGDHQVTRQEVDTKVLESLTASELYDRRKQALDALVDDYVVDEAAKKAGMSPAAYLQHEGAAARVTDDDARKFYDEHKAQIQSHTGNKTFDQIKPMLVPALQRHNDVEQRTQLIEKLRADNHVKVNLEAPHVKVASAGHPATAATAPVTVVEFSDFQCPYCRAAENSLAAVRAKYGNHVRIVYMDFPLSFHPHSMDAAKAGRCAGEQGKFWQFHDALFADQSKLEVNDLKATAKKIGLDSARFDSCFDKGKSEAGIRKDMAEGAALGVTGTPTFFINGRELIGAQPPEKFNEIIDDEIARGKPPVNEAKAN